MDSFNWTNVSQNLTIDPVTYGRYLQVVIDLDKVYVKRDRRFKIKQYVSQLLPNSIIVRAKDILGRLKENLGRKNSIDNKFYQMDVVYKNAIHLTDQEKLYYGRCIQFLLDANRKQYRLDDLLEKSSNEIIKMAHLKKDRILARQEKLFDVDCDCEGCDFNGDEYHSSCMWEIGDKRCECGNRRYSWCNEPIYNLDVTSPSGYPENY